MRNVSNNIVLICMILTMAFACKKKEYESIQSVDAKLINAFIAQNSLKVNQSDSGYYYQISTVGSGPLLKYSDSVVYQMVIKSLTGTTFFETNKYNPTENLLGYFPNFLSVQQTLNGIPNGSSIRVIIPSYNAFGMGGNTALGIGAHQNLDISVATQIITDREKYEDSLINLYVKDKNLTGLVKTEEGIYYKVITNGDMTNMINENSNVTAAYTLRVMGFDGAIEASTLTSNLNTLIKGWGLVLRGQSKGVKIRCFIPSRYAYGNGSSVKTGVNTSSLANTILDYDIEVTNIN